MTVRILVIDDELARVEYKRQEFLMRWNLFPTGVFASKLEFTFISSQHVHSNRIENDVALAVAFVGQNPQHWGMVLLDMQFDHGTLVHGEPREAEPRFGLKIQAALEQAFPDLPILQFTAQTQRDLAHEGGHYLSKIDGTPDDLRNQLIERGRLTLADKRLLLQIPPDTVVASDATLKVYAQVYRLARTKAALLILGETGTGKTKLAEYFHKVSANAAGSFKTLDMPRKLLAFLSLCCLGMKRVHLLALINFRPGYLAKLATEHFSSTK